VQRLFSDYQQSAAAEAGQHRIQVDQAAQAGEGIAGSTNRQSSSFSTFPLLAAVPRPPLAVHPPGTFAREAETLATDPGTTRSSRSVQSTAGASGSLPAGGGGGGGGA
jgi:hypothetical protein